MSNSSSNSTSSSWMHSWEGKSFLRGWRWHQLWLWNGSRGLLVFSYVSLICERLGFSFHYWIRELFGLRCSAAGFSHVLQYRYQQAGTTFILWFEMKYFDFHINVISSVGSFPVTSRVTSILSISFRALSPSANTSVGISSKLWHPGFWQLPERQVLITNLINTFSIGEESV